MQISQILACIALFSQLSKAYDSLPEWGGSNASDWSLPGAKPEASSSDDDYLDDLYELDLREDFDNLISTLEASISCARKCGVNLLSESKFVRRHQPFSSDQVHTKADGSMDVYMHGAVTTDETVNVIGPTGCMALFIFGSGNKRTATAFDPQTMKTAARRAAEQAKQKGVTGSNAVIYAVDKLDLTDVKRELLKVFPDMKVNHQYYEFQLVDIHIKTFTSEKGSTEIKQVTELLSRWPAPQEQVSP